MTKNLVIVESPAKAKTIEKFLGKDFTVKSSFGHIRDLPKKGMSIDIEGGTFEPTYEVSTDKKKTVTELKKLSKDAVVWLAADEDREGEAIAWHLKEALKLDPKKTKRIVFHEITKPAILHAVENPRELDTNLVDAQQARRVLDRLVGYELSPVLWKKVRTGLSAGRVQSVAVRLIVEREREIEAFDSTSTFKITAEFDLGGGKVLKAELPKKFETVDEAKKFLESCIGANFKVSSLETSPGKRSPSAPFTTSTLQQEASRKLGFSVKQTMTVAQRLYEAGKITYMRTDSVNLSDQALGQAGNEIESRYGKEFVQIRKYKTKSSGAQEAHEAIRPTDLANDSVSGDAGQSKLYSLIWKRTIASQMAEAKLEKTTATIDISTRKTQLIAKGEVVKFEGFLKVYFEGTDEENGDDPLAKKMLPPLKVGQELTLDTMQAGETFSRPPARYTEASLVKKMEEMGIGRPSTYAPTISTIQDRGYVEKGDLEGKERKLQIFLLKSEKITDESRTEITGADKSKLLPTDIGNVVTDFLVKHFPKIVDYNFTVQVEEEFDSIAHGKQKWNKMISEFYTPFRATVDEAADISREEAQQVRELGVDPESGKPVLVRVGRYGPMFQIGTKDDEEKPRFASLPVGKKMDEVTLEDALELFKLPRIIGQTKDGEDIGANFGRFGPYIKFGSKFVSIKPDDPFTITLERALELIEEKKKADKEKFIQTFEGSDIQVLKGQYGPYITDGKKNAKIPKDKEPAKLTLKECEALIKEAPTKKRRFVKK
jgi:DNA topoisomerase I